MEWILLIPKDESPADKNVTVADELFTGLVRGETWMTTISGSVGPTETFVKNFKWPKKADTELPRSVSFLQGHNPELANQIEFYEA